MPSRKARIASHASRRFLDVGSKPRPSNNVANWSWWHTVPKQEEDESEDVAATTSTREYEPLLLSWPIVECANVIFHLRNEFTPPLTIAVLSHSTIQIARCERSVADQMHAVRRTPRCDIL
mgnify:CR=1 FL=1